MNSIKNFFRGGFTIKGRMSNRLFNAYYNFEKDKEPLLKLLDDLSQNDSKTIFLSCHQSGLNLLHRGATDGNIEVVRYMRENLAYFDQVVDEPTYDQVRNPCFEFNLCCLLSRRKPLRFPWPLGRRTLR
jgi:hypothetical protein